MDKQTIDPYEEEDEPTGVAWLFVVAFAMLYKLFSFKWTRR